MLSAGAAGAISMDFAFAQNLCVATVKQGARVIGWMSLMHGGKPSGRQRRPYSSGPVG